MKTGKNRNIAGLALLAVLTSGCSASAPVTQDELADGLRTHDLVLEPPGEGPFPAVLLLHTCYGNLGHVDAWARDLRDRGYVAVVVNSMRARNLDGHFDRLAVCGGRVLRSPDRSRDVALAIDRLRASGSVDADRIGIVGFSHGGWTALDFLGSPPGSGDARTRSVVAVYPYCGAEAMEGLEGWPPDVSVLMLLAGNDTTVGTEECEQMARAQVARGLAVDVHVYAGAQHGYDIDPELLYGYDLRYDAAAARDTRRRVLEFLERTLEAGTLSTTDPGSGEASTHVQNSHRRLR